MKQVFVHAPHDVRIDDVPSDDRPLGPYELRVKTEMTALSPGTETRIYSGLERDRFSYRVQYPYAVGYNNIARVVEIGDKVTEYRVGQRVFSRMPHQSESIVAEKSFIDPTLSTNPNVPSSYNTVAPVPENVPSVQAVFTHLFVLGFNSLQRADYRFGENVVVIGLGVVGLGAVAMAHLGGARVAAIGNDAGRLEIARAMCTRPLLLCLDEPAAGLNARESEGLNELLYSIREKEGISLLLIEHDMSVVMRISDHVVVLDYGKTIADGTAQEVRNDPSVIAAYLGVPDEEVRAVEREVGL